GGIDSAQRAKEAEAPLRCPQRQTAVRTPGVLRRETRTPTLAALRLRCSQRGSNSRLGTGLRREWTAREETGRGEHRSELVRDDRRPASPRRADKARHPEWRPPAAAPGTTSDKPTGCSGLPTARPCA